MLASCASKPGDGTNDPFESINREIFDINMALDKAILRPVTQAYVDNVPDPIRDMIHNLLFHLKEPVTLANDLLQGGSTPVHASWCVQPRSHDWFRYST